ncbi:hypothetical protein HWV62_22004 [Athelia sp. TMB]|nr:hypothetical protein HWV62_22004 [Athelia sp. TMB]
MSENPTEQATGFKTFYCNDQIITSPNADLPAIFDCDAMGRIFSDPPFPGECRELRYSSNAYPWLGFVPKTLRWQGRLLGKLAYNKRTVRSLVEWRRHTHFFNDEIYEEWYQLEIALVHVANELIAFSGVALPLEWALFPLPSHYSYREGHLGLEKFVKSIMLARDAFVPLMSLCSFAIAMTREFRSKNPPWAHRLVDRGCHTSFVEELQDSQIADFSEDRIGVVIKDTWHFQPYTDRFLAAGVPVWLLWQTKTSFTHHRTKIYCPSNEDVATAKQNPHAYPTAPVVSSHLSTQALCASAGPQSFPPLPKLSRQLVGETFEGYFLRQDRIREEKLATETPDNRARRLNRERAQERHQLPGKGGPVVFIWEEVNGWLIRTKLDRKQVDDEWENFTDSQRKFNSINNEWDLAVQFAPQEEPQRDFDDEYDDYLHPMDISPIRGPAELPTTGDVSPVPPPSTAPPSVTPSSLALLPLPPANYVAVLANAYKPPVPITSLRGLEPLDLVVYNRYGFVWHDLKYDPDAVLKRPRSAPDWDSTRRVLCDKASRWCATVSQDPLSDFVDCFIHGRDIPASFWDVCAENGQYILGTGKKTKNTLRTVSYEGKKLYLIEIDPSAVNFNEDPAYEVLVEDPLTALECLRRKQLVNRREIVKHLITTGKSFMTRASTSQLPYPQSPSVKWNRPPGYRRPTWKPDMLDYKHYENHRNDFLLTPRSRAAVKYGGIVWRLSVQSIDPDYVAAGPSSEIFATSRAKYFDHDEARYWDDELIDEEIDIICGVYKIDTAQGSSHQTSDSSWWPKPNIWKGSGLDIGYWSPTCEIWYQIRLKAIHEGKATVRTASEWRKSLKLWKHTSVFIQAIRAQSAQAISDFYN